MSFCLLTQNFHVRELPYLVLKIRIWKTPSKIGCNFGDFKVFFKIWSNFQKFHRNSKEQKFVTYIMLPSPTDYHGFEWINFLVTSANLLTLEHFVALYSPRLQRIKSDSNRFWWFPTNGVGSLAMTRFCSLSLNILGRSTPNFVQHNSHPLK